MKSASEKAIAEASRLLLNSVVEENNEPRDGSSDDSVIGSLHREAETLAAALRSINGSLSKRLANKRRERNAHAPIYRLPPEILIKIFHARIAQIEIRDHVATLHGLACVSHCWAGIVRETPALWGFLSSELSETLFGTVLRQSLNATLTVHLGPVYGERDFNPVLEACKHVARWSWATLTLHGLRDDVREHLERAAPQITHISITAFARPVSLDLFGGQADRLQYLQLVRVGIPYNTPMLSGLTHLELRDTPIFPSREDLFRILRCSQSLRSLILSVVQAIPDPHLDPENEQPLTLQSLNVLRLYSLPPKYCNAIVRGLKTPVCNQLTIELDFFQPVGWAGTHLQVAQPHPISLTEVLGPSAGTIRRVLAATSKLRLQAGNLIFRLQCRSDNVSRGLVIGLKGLPPTEAFAWLTRSFKDQLANISLTVSLTRGLSSTDPLFFPALEVLSNVVTLSVENGTVGIQKFFDYLSECIVDGDVKRWHLPHLRELIIASTEPADHQQLATVLQRRYGLVGDPSASNGGASPAFKQELPSKLEILRVACRDQAMQQQLRSIVGPEAFHEISSFDHAFGAGMLPEGFPPAFGPGMGGPPNAQLGFEVAGPQGWDDIPGLMEGPPPFGPIFGDGTDDGDFGEWTIGAM